MTDKQQKPVVSAFQLTNFMCFKQLEFTPEGLEIITGKNAAGKSTIIKALKVLFGAEYPEAAVTVGEDNGEIKAVINMDGRSFNASVKMDASNRRRYSVETSEGWSVKSPKTWLEQLAILVQLNPLSFAEMGRGGVKQRREQVKLLLDAMDVKLTEAKLMEVGFNLADYPEEVQTEWRKVMENQGGVEALASIKSGLLDQQKLNNSKVKDLEEEQRHLPKKPDAEPDTSKIEERLAKLREDRAVITEKLKTWKRDQERLEGLNTKLAAVKERLAGNAKELKALAKEKDPADKVAAAEAEVERLKKALADAEAKLEGLKEQAREFKTSQDKIKSIKETAQRDQTEQKDLEADIKAIQDAKKPTGTEEIDKEGVELKAKLEAMKDDVDAWKKHQDWEPKATKLTARLALADRIKTALELCRDAIPAELMKHTSLDIPGLELSGDGISVNNVPFSDMNQADQIRLSMAAVREIAKARGLAPLMTVDEAEKLDDDMVKVIFEDMAKNPGWQVFFTTVPRSAIADHATRRLESGKLVDTKPVEGQQRLL